MTRYHLTMFWAALAIAAIGWLLASEPAHAAEADIYCLTGTTSTGAPNWQPASSANPCPTSGGGGSGSTTPTIQAAGTVTTGGTFQQVLAANTSRTACYIQNTSTDIAYVYWLGSGTPTTSNSVQVAAGNWFSCANGSGEVIKTAIRWTAGTTGDTFVLTENQ